MDFVTTYITDDVNFPHLEFHKMFPCEPDKTDAMIIYENFDFFYERKQLDPHWLKDMASAKYSTKSLMIRKLEKIRTYMSNDTIETIEEKAHKNDSEAVLTLADCLLFGLKELELDHQTAMQMYCKAGTLLSNGEAVTTEAFIREIRREWALKLKTAKQIDLDMMNAQIWNDLNMAAVVNWISPFLLRKAKMDRDSGAWALTPRIINVLYKFEQILKNPSSSAKSNENVEDVAKFRQMLLPYSFSGLGTVASSRYSKKELVKKADEMMARGSYADAMRCLNLAIEKQIANKSVFAIINKLEDQLELAKLVGRRAKCHLNIAYRNYSIKHSLLAEKDCDLVLPQHGLIKNYLIDKKSQVYLDLMDTFTKSVEFNIKYFIF
jgi:hypothetical protein